MADDGVKVLEKLKTREKGLKLMLSQVVTFPKPIRAWNPKTELMEYRRHIEILFDASIPQDVYSAYEGFSIGRDSKSRILILLATLGYSYPTKAISEAANIARTTTSRLLWEMRKDGLIEGASSTGMYIDSLIWPYRYGPLRENYWMLTEKGFEEAEKLMKRRVTPFLPLGAVEDEMKEHPWMNREQAERAVSEHRKALERAKKLRKRLEKGKDELTDEELRFLFGSRARRIEEIIPREMAGRLAEPLRRREEEKEEPWERAARLAEEARAEYERNRS